MICEQKDVTDFDKFSQIIKQCVNKRKLDLLGISQNSGGDLESSVHLFLRILQEIEMDLVRLL